MTQRPVQHSLIVWAICIAVAREVDWSISTNACWIGENSAGLPLEQYFVYCFAIAIRNRSSGVIRWS
jgi:hypothetical protein